uniref:Uncharacterized protein n=1 Tax=Vespula pensylvanica TaxID=30213 RepID=A0A834K197_VESPE|nr:hypothetical protein H0235_016271 [Vespula pensylvanica]
MNDYQKLSSNQILRMMMVTAAFHAYALQQTRASSENGTKEEIEVVVRGGGGCGCRVEDGGVLRRLGWRRTWLAGAWF